MQITDCKSDTGYLNYFGEGMLCKKEAAASLFDDQGLNWWNCSQYCVTSEIKSTMNTPLVPCCNSLEEYGLKFVNSKCFIDVCGFCSIYLNNFVALEQIFAENVENIYWQQILNFMEYCDQRTSRSTERTEPPSQQTTSKLETSTSEALTSEGSTVHTSVETSTNVPSTDTTTQTSLDTSTTTTTSAPSPTT